MRAYGREVALAEELVELRRARNPRNENDNLVKLERIEKVAQLPVLLLFFEVDVVLLEAMERQFALVIDVDLERNWQNPAHGADLFRKCGAEQHDLLVVRRLAEVDCTSLRISSCASILSHSSSTKCLTLSSFMTPSLTAS